MTRSPTISRRSFALGGIAAAVTAAVAGAVYEVPRLLKRRAHGEYAELVNHLEDPEAAAIVGRALQAATPIDREELEGLKSTLAKQPLPSVLAGDVRQGRLTDIDGWVLPATLAELCGLAAQSL